MRALDYPITEDWFVISLRWLAIFGVVISLGASGLLFFTPSLLWLGLASWNTVQSALVVLNKRMTRQREVSLLIDLFVIGLYFGLSGGFHNPAFWAGLIPLLSASIYFGMRGALIAASAVALIQIAFTSLSIMNLKALYFPTASALIIFLLASIFGFLSEQIISDVRQMQRKQIEEQRKRQRVEHERLHAIYNLTSTLMTTLNYQHVLDTLLDLSLSALNPKPGIDSNDRLISAALLFNPADQLEIGSARGLTPADLRIHLPGKDGVIGKSIENGEPIVTSEINSDPELGRIVALHNCSQIYCFPLRSGFNVYGVIIFGHNQSDYFTPDRCEVLDILCRQAVIAIQNARLHQDLVDERDRMIEVQDEARKKLARDLHDGPAQLITVIATRLNLARRILEKNPQNVGEELDRIEELAKRTTKEIRHMLFTMRPLILESQGLVAALQTIAEKMKETYAQKVNINIDESMLYDMELGKQGVIFYIVEEAVNNARKHAKANHIWVHLRPIGQDTALLEIQDDGIGFNVDLVTHAYDERDSLGMVNLRERSELINGLLNIHSVLGKGTRVRVFIPLNEEAADRLHHAAGKR